MDNQREVLRGHLIQLLDRFVEVCQKNELRYYLAYGTVLGAVRHKGLIPWDDDIDVHMPREDYEIIQRLQPSIWGDMKLTSRRLTPNNQYHFLKLENPNTTVIEQLDPLYVGGVYLDIFPLDKAPEEKEVMTNQLRKIRKIQEKYYIISVKHGCDYRGLVNGIKFRCRHFIYQRQRIQDTWERLACEFETSDSNLYVDFHQPEDWHYQSMPMDWFGKGVQVDFEGRKFIVPENYDAYLTHIYGDYMTPPPEDKREGHEFLYLNLNEKVSRKQLDQIVRELRKKTAFRFNLDDEIQYWRTKLKL